MTHARLGLAAVLALLPHAGRAQDIPLRGYALNVVIANSESPFADAGAQDLQRFRLMLSASPDLVDVDVAYEQLLTVSSLDLTSTATIGGLLGTPSRGDWLPLQGEIAGGAHASWRHRLDRASVGLRGGPVEGRVGRQTISWGTTLFLTPADPFAPFDPADPFRDYRIGVDAARVRAFPSALTEVDGVVRIASYQDTTVVTALGRGRFALGRTDVMLWGGMLHEEAAAALGITTIVLDGALRSEIAVREDTGGVVVRAAVGADRSFTVAGRTLYAVVEYQYDGFGATSGDDLLRVIGSAPYQRGEMQVLGRHEIAAQVTYDVHPLVQIGALGLWNAGDRSTLLTPSLQWNAGRELTVRSGVYVGIGATRSPVGLPASEYGAVPPTAYAAGTLFF